MSNENEVKNLSAYFVEIGDPKECYSSVSPWRTAYAVASARLAVPVLP
jgi:hypothetical protein